MKLAYVEVGQIVNTHGVRGRTKKYSPGATAPNSSWIFKPSTWTETACIPQQCAFTRTTYF